MDRPIQVGDFVLIIPLSGLIKRNIYGITSINPQPSITTITIQSVEDPFNYETIIVDPSGIKLQGSNVDNEIIFGVSRQELEKMSFTRDVGAGEIKFGLTGVESVDINILAQMNDDDLTSACRIDRYANELCRKDTLWRQKTSMKFPGAENFKDDTTNTWKDYYFRLTWIDLDQNGVNIAAENGYLDVLNWIESLPNKIYPDQLGLKRSAKNGHVKVLQWLADRNIHTINDHPLILAAGSGKIEVLQWYISLPPLHQKFPDQLVVENGGTNGNLNVLKWISSLPSPHNIYPDQGNVNQVVMNHKPGAVKVLEWISTLPPPHNLLPGRRYLNHPLQVGDFDILDWLAQHNILPSGARINNAASFGRLDILKWASKYNLYPDKRSVGMAGHDNHYEVVMWASTLPDPHTIYPVRMTINNAAIKGRLDVVQWGATLPKEHRMYPDQYALDKVKELGHNDIIEWLSTQPGPSGEYARKLLE